MEGTCRWVDEQWNQKEVRGRDHKPEACSAEWVLACAQ